MIYGTWRFLLYGAALAASLYFLLPDGGRKNGMGGTRLLDMRGSIWQQALFGTLTALALVLVFGGLSLLVYGSFSMLRFMLLRPSQIAEFIAFQLLVAVTEELLFRALGTKLCAGLLRINGGKALTVFLTAFIFAALHYINSHKAIQFAVAFIIGAVFEALYLYEKRCSVYALMLAHFLYDITVT